MSTEIDRCMPIRIEKVSNRLLLVVWDSELEGCSILETNDPIHRSMAFYKLSNPDIESWSIERYGSVVCLNIYGRINPNL